MKNKKVKMMMTQGKTSKSGKEGMVYGSGHS